MDQQTLMYVGIGVVALVVVYMIFKWMKGTSNDGPSTNTVMGDCPAAWSDYTKNGAAPFSGTGGYCSGFQLPNGACVDMVHPNVCTAWGVNGWKQNEFCSVVQAAVPSPYQLGAQSEIVAVTYAPSANDAFSKISTGQMAFRNQNDGVCTYSDDPSMTMMKGFVQSPM